MVFSTVLALFITPVASQAVPVYGLQDFALLNNIQVLDPSGSQDISTDILRVAQAAPGQSVALTNNLTFHESLALTGSVQHMSGAPLDNINQIGGWISGPSIGVPDTLAVLVSPDTSGNGRSEFFFDVNRLDLRDALARRNVANGDRVQFDQALLVTSPPSNPASENGLSPLGVLQKRFQEGAIGASLDPLTGNTRTVTSNGGMIQGTASPQLVWSLTATSQLPPALGPIIDVQGVGENTGATNAGLAAPPSLSKVLNQSRRLVRLREPLEIYFIA